MRTSIFSSGGFQARCYTHCVDGHQIAVCWDLKCDSAKHKCSLCRSFELRANGLPRGAFLVSFSGGT